MSRSSLLQRIRKFQSAGPKTPLPEGLPAFPSFEDPVEQFKDVLESVGGVFLDGRSEGSLGALIEQVLRDTGSFEVYWETDTIFRRHAIPCRLRNERAFADGMLVFSVHPRPEVALPIVLHSKRSDRISLDEIQLSVSSAVWGIAETGTVLHETAKGTGRLLNILPPNHLVFLSQRDLFSALPEAIEKAGLDTHCSLGSLTSGPSQTADIEKRLVRGVHGPGRWFVVLTP